MKINKNKKGFVIELMVFLVIGIISVLIFWGFIYGTGLINDTLTSGKLDSNSINVTQASNATFTPFSNGLEQLKIVAIFIFLGFAMSSMIVGYFSRTHPLMLVVYIFFTILLTILSFYISNSYTTMITSLNITQFVVMNFFMDNLPYWIIFIGFITSAISIGGRFGGQQ